jgi:MoaA/NifB/PqqE/SkfB family radical SAM enzyme
MAEGPVYYRFELADSSIDLRELKALLPEGPAKAWVLFHPEEGEDRYSPACAFCVRSGVEMVREPIVRERDGMRVIGPVNTWRIVGNNAPLWRRGGRPRIAEPHHMQVVGTQPRLVAFAEDPGRKEILLHAQLDEPLYYKIILGDQDVANLQDLGIELPEGDYRAWVLLYQENGFPRKSLGRQFTVKRNIKPGVLLLQPRDWEQKRQAFYENLECLSYEGNLRLRQEEIATHQSILASAPSFVQMSVGHVCNLDCIMCSTGRNPDRTSLPPGVVEDLPKLFQFLDRIMIQGGEPLAFKSIHDVLSKAQEHRHLTVSIGTNGVLLERGWLDLVLNGRYDLNISFDAVNKETYERIRRNGDWDILLQALQRIKYERKGPYPHLMFSMCVMRSNVSQITDFVDFSYKYGAQSVYYNLMWPAELDKGYESENLFGDKDALREVAWRIREATARATQLGLSMRDKVLGYIFADHPDLVLDDDDLATLNLRDQERVKARIPENRLEEDVFWDALGGRPTRKPLPGHEEECGYKVPDNPVLFPPKPSNYPIEIPSGFFCTYPFHILNFDVENTYVCCHAYPPYNYMSYVVVSNAFDVWNHTLMQGVRKAMFNGTAADDTCHPRCPHYRYGGYRRF